MCALAIHIASHDLLVSGYQTCNDEETVGRIVKTYDIHAKP